MQQSPTPSVNHGLIVSFHRGSRPNTFRTELEGRPIVDEIDMIEIAYPGDNKTYQDRMVVESDKVRYPAEWVNYQRSQAGETSSVDGGTPLREWGAFPQALIRDFEFARIFTVEQLASLSDTAKQAMGTGTNDWCIKAQAFIESSRDQNYAPRLARENEDMKRQMADMVRQMAELSAKVAAKPEPDETAPMVEKRGPGRPPRAQEAA